MAVFALGQLVLTGVGIWYIRRTLTATESAVKEAADATDAAREAVAETSRVGEAQVRAYLSVVGAKYTDEAPPRKNPQLDLVLNNSGSTPAISVSYFCGSKVTTFGEGHDFLCPDFVPFTVSMSSVPGNETREDGAMCFSISTSRRDYDAALALFDEHTLLRRAPVLIIFGSLFYEDVFGVTYRSNFAFLAEPRGGPREMSLSVTNTPQANFRRIDDRTRYIRPPNDDP